MSRNFPFSNFQVLSVPIVDSMGITYKTVEHAYQAAKTLSKEERLNVASCYTAAQAKKMGRKVTIRKDWDKTKDKIMSWCLKHKFLKCQEHRKALENYTGQIIEFNYWHDNYWGVCTCSKCDNKGLNRLGKMIDEIKWKKKIST